ncbi:MAG: ribokinase [Deltaproteobacteria bacterium]|nr:ribokinase [Deltaproteobacteria bacterium]
MLVEEGKMPNSILVLGSSNVDLILKVPRFNQPGETIRADHLTTVYGGKGANQAIAAKRLGAEVALITRLGDDHYGQSYRRYLTKKGLNPKSIFLDKKVPTGIAFIELDTKGENRIVVAPGSNSYLSIDDLRKYPPLFRKIKVFVTQLEIPFETVTMGLKMAKKYGALTLLNPSPSRPLSNETLSLTDFLIPNELEAQSLTGLKMRTKQDLPKMATTLLKMGVKNVVITLGSKGLFFKNPYEEIWMEAFKVKVVDTTAAGDAFMGGLACGLSEGKPIWEALMFGNAAGALATTKLGAQPSLPSRKELIRFLKRY